jgi:glutamate decarboxylase
MLAGMALKRRWAARTGADPSRRPNLVMGANVQVCWEKFCRYWEVEPRLVPVSGDRLCLGAEEAVAACDENTIGVVAVLGSTFDGRYEPVAGIAAALDELAGRSGPDVPLHVDAASGGMVAPFLEPELLWDFRIPRVASINPSGHKYGLVYPGVGWALWRDADALPEDLVFTVDYLGGQMPTFALNFSRPGAEVVAQYYMFFRLGREGYRAVQQASRDVATFLAERIGAMPQFRMISHGDELPVLTFTTTEAVSGWDVYAVSTVMRERGWQVPAYSFPPDREDLSVLRVVCRNGFSRDLSELFLTDLGAAVEELAAGAADGPGRVRSGFHH